MPAKKTPLAQDLADLMEFDVKVCPVCTLIKTLPEDESYLLQEAYRIGVPIIRIYRAFKKNGHKIGEHQFYGHRDCLGAQDAE